MSNITGRQSLGLRKVLTDEKRREWLKKLIAAVSLPEREAAARRENWAKMRGDVWLRYVMTETRWSWSELKRELRRNRSRSSLVDKWRSGTVNPYRVSAEKLDSHAPGSLALFDLPMWNLLDQGSKTERDILLLERKAKDSGLLPDAIGGTVGMDNAYRGMYPRELYGSASLVMEGTISAFNQLVVMVRRAEASSDDKSHATHIENLYLLFPTIAKIPYFRPSTIGIAQAITDLHHRVEWSRVKFAVDWEVIKSAIEAPADESEREELLMSWIGRQVSHHKNPIIHGKVEAAADVENPSVILDLPNGTDIDNGY